MDLSTLFRRDLTRLVKQIEAFQDTAILWSHARGVTNSAGNLVLHIEGNLREYIGRQLGNVDYSRDRQFEFAATGLPKEDLLYRIEDLKPLITLVLESFTEERMKSPYPEDVLSCQLSVEDFLIHLYGHLNWHLGQIDSLRRVLTEGGPIPPVEL